MVGLRLDALLVRLAGLGAGEETVRHRLEPGVAGVVVPVVEVEGELVNVVESVDGGGDTADLAPAGGGDVRRLGSGRGRAGSGGRGGAGGAGVGVEDDEAAGSLELGEGEDEVGVPWSRSWSSRVGRPGLVVGHAGGAGDLGVAGTLGVVSVLWLKILLRRREMSWAGASCRTDLVVVLGDVPVVDHARPRPPTPGPTGAPRDGLLLGLVDAGLAVQAGGVRAGAVQAARHPGRPLLLQQLGDYRLHGLGCLVKRKLTQIFIFIGPYRDLQLAV